MSKINYQYGVEYATNGEKPNLPDDVLVQVYTPKCGWSWTIHVMQGAWYNATRFRIVDERYKPKTEQPTKAKDDWFVRGDFPPAGISCEVLSGGEWHKTFIVGMNGKYCVYDSRDFEPYNYNGEDNPANFRPIKSKREKFIDAVWPMIYMIHKEASITELMAKELAAKLYDAEFRAPQ